MSYDFIEKLGDWSNSILIIFVVFIVLVLILITFVDRNDQKELDSIGERLCAEEGHQFYYVSGETIRCYDLDLITGQKIKYEYWIDMKYARAYYR